VRFAMRVLSGKLPCGSCEIKAGKGASVVRLNGRDVPHRVERTGDRALFRFTEPVILEAESELRLEVKA
jgi:hypothetical protein